MKRPRSDVIKVGPCKGFWATWEGGEYIDIWACEEDLTAHARGEEAAAAVGVLNTTGVVVGDDRVAYVQAELREWADEHGHTYRAKI